MFLAVALLLIIGIIATYSTPRLLFHVHKHEGWLIYLNSAKIGSYCVLASYIFSDYIFPYATALIYCMYTVLCEGVSMSSAFHNLLNLPKPQSLFSIANYYIEKRVPASSLQGREFSLFLSSILITTFFLTLIVRIVHPLFAFGFVAATNEASEVFSSKSYLDDLLLEASVNLEYILVSVDGGKCYVGLIEEMPLAIQENGVGVEAIKLFIVKSGHRTEDTQAFEIDHDYDTVWLSVQTSIRDKLAEIEEKGVTYENYPTIKEEIVEPIISIPRERIVSVSKYDSEYYHSFNSVIVSS